MNSAPLVTGSVLAAIAGVIHVYIFVLESLRWTHPATWRIFGLRSQADAETTRLLAYNQGFYNLFLALGAFIGIALLGVNVASGLTLILASTISMVLAAVVLVTSSRRSGRSAAMRSASIRPAAIQGTAPLLAVLFITLSFVA